jgi:phosphoenolpyruvate carboxylase
MSYAQVILLERLRKLGTVPERGLSPSGEREREEVWRAVHLSINGVAQGLRNTG